MEPEWIVMRLAYFILFVTLALMTWAYMVQAQLMAERLIAEPLITRGHQGNVLDMYPPCSFNPLCTCSKPGPTEFGIVACHDVPFGNIPVTLNSSRTFLLSMIGNNMQVLDEKRLVGSGLWRLEIKENRLQFIADDAFLGLSKFLSELDLTHNELTTIPTNALRRLAKPAKLRILNLGHNRITDIQSIDLEGLPSSITCLGLASNMITYIPEDAFANLDRLEKIDLSDNSIQFIHTHAFTSLSRSLKRLHLSNNMFEKIPFQALAYLDLKLLDMSNNLIISTFDIFFDKKLTVGELNLEYNRIAVMPPYSFQNFRKISIVRLSYNPIEVLLDDSFKDGKMDELYLSHCFIRDIQPKVYRGLENTLEKLDLSFNNISHLPFELFENFDRLRHLNLDQNQLKLSPEEMENFRLFTLHKFSVIGDKMATFPMEDIELMRNLRSLNISNFGLASLTPEVFEGLGLAVEEIKISQGRLTSVRSGAFKSLTGLKSVDLSENRIERIDDGAFDGVGHSVVKLTMHDSSRMGTLPVKAFRKLIAVRYLDLSSNGFNHIPDNSFEESKQLIHLNLRFNKITSISKTLFEYTRVPRIQRIFLSFNSIREIKEMTFSRLKELEFIELNENLIETISTKAFEDLTNLRILNLAGNRIASLKDEAFQNLPRLQILDLSHNRLTFINMDSFEQLGTLSSFHINWSHNNIQRLENMDSMETGMQVQQPAIHQFQHPNHPSPSTEEGSEEDVEPLLDEHIPNVASISSSSIESIDLSHNNISFIAPFFFYPISSTLIELDLSHNKLPNLTLDHFSGMKFIQHLQLSNNLLDTIEYNAFRESHHLQVIDLSNNMLRDFPPDMFEGCVNLRVLTAKDNKIRALIDSLFKDTQLEILNMAGNQLVRFPENSLAKVASTLVHLDLSRNEISSLAPSQIECLQKLRWLNLADNRIVVIADPTFDFLHSLLCVDLSGNPMGKVSSRMFEGIKDSLLHLHLSNMSLDVLPEFDTFSKLLTFNSSYNRLTYLPTNFGVNVSSLRTLDISGNEIPAPPNTIWHTIPRLTNVLMKSNPIRILTNDSFLQLERLHELDISELPLESVQVGAFAPLGCLEKVTLGPLSPLTNPGSLIQSVVSLQSVHLKMNSPMMSLELRAYPIPPKVSSITVSGKGLFSISAGSFYEIVGRRLKLTLQDTGLTDLSYDVLHFTGDATQLSLAFLGNNSALRTISNPNSQYRQEAFATYLEDLEFDEGMILSCSCETGWIEFWLRQWMEKTCPVGSPTPKDESMRCNQMLDMLRSVRCQNKPGTDLMHAFIVDLECGWKSESRRIKTFQSVLLSAFLFTIVIPYWITGI